MAQLGEDLRQLLAFGQHQPHAAVAREIAGGCQHQVAHAREAHEGRGLGAQGQAQTQHLGQAAGDQRSAGVEARCAVHVAAQAQPIGGTDGDRHHVLDGPAHFHADRIVGGVDAQTLAMEGIDCGLSQICIFTGGHQRCGLTRSHFLRKARARENAHAQARLHLAGDLVAKQAGAGFEALAQPEHTSAIGQLREHAAQCGHGGADDDQPIARAMRDGGGQIGANGQVQRKIGLRQIARIAPFPAHLGRCGRIARPQQHLVAGSDRLDGQRRAPGTGAQDADLQRFRIS